MPETSERSRASNSLHRNDPWSMNTERDDPMRALLEAAREVERWYYERDVLWVDSSAEERQEADAAVIALHDALVALGEPEVAGDG
jgi:hypothetical protein